MEGGVDENILHPRRAAAGPPCVRSAFVMDSDPPSSDDLQRPHAPGSRLLGRLLRALVPAAVFSCGDDRRSVSPEEERFWREIEQDICSCLVRPGDVLDMVITVGNLAL